MPGGGGHGGGGGGGHGGGGGGRPGGGGGRPSGGGRRPGWGGGGRRRWNWGGGGWAGGGWWGGGWPYGYSYAQPYFGDYNCITDENGFVSCPGQGVPANINITTAPAPSSPPPAQPAAPPPVTKIFVERTAAPAAGLSPASWAGISIGTVFGLLVVVLLVWAATKRA